MRSPASHTTDTMSRLHPSVPPGPFDLAELLSWHPPTRWRPNDGERIVGDLAKIEDRSAFGRSAPTLFVLIPPCPQDPKTAKYMVVRASGVVLRGALDDLKPQPGERIAILYPGKRTTADGTREYAYYRLAVYRGGAWVVSR